MAADLVHVCHDKIIYSCYGVSTTQVRDEYKTNKKLVNTQCICHIYHSIYSDPLNDIVAHKH